MAEEQNRNAAAQELVDLGEAATLKEGRRMLNAKSWASYDEGAVLVRERGLTTREQFCAWCKENPEEWQRLPIPTRPDQIYKDLGWSKWSDFFGLSAEEVTAQKVTTGKRNADVKQKRRNVAAQVLVGSGEAATLEEGRRVMRTKSWVTYDKCAALVRELELKSPTPQFKAWCKENPEERQRLRIPSNPNRTYNLLGWPTWSAFFEKAEARQEAIAEPGGDRCSSANPCCDSSTAARGLGKVAALDEENETRRKNVAKP